MSARPAVIRADMSRTFTLAPPERQLADEFRLRIRKGVWGERMPGIMKLVREFGVSRPLVEKALAILVEAGDVRPTGRGRAMRTVRRDRASERERSGVLVVYDFPEGMRAGPGPVLLDTVERALAGPANHVQLDSMAPPGETVARLRETDAGTLIIMNHRAAVADTLARDGRRVLRIGGPGVCEVAPSMSVSYAALVRGAFRRAFAAGHRRVCMPLWLRKPEMIPVLRGWIAEEYAAAGVTHSPAFDAPEVAAPEASAMHACVRELCRHTPPTCFVLNDQRHWVAVFSALAEKRLRVPDDVSTILLAASAEMEVATPSQAYFRHPIESFVPEIRRILRRRDRGIGMPAVLIEPKWVPGDSLAAPAAIRPEARK